LLGLWACDQKNEDVIEPLDPNARPQVILFDNEEEGVEEDNDGASFSLTLLDRIDPEGEELGGKVIPLTANVTVNFKVTDLEGFDKISDYILDVEASYEVDDCNDEDVTVSFNPTNGEGTVVFPAGAEEVEVNFELNDGLFDDDEVNEDGRGFKVQITGISGGGSNVVVNSDLEFELKVLDDEVIFAEWELDVDDELADFKALFAEANEDVADLVANDIDGIKFEFGLNGFEIEIELEEEEENDCGELEQKTIEIEAEYDGLTDDDTSGEIKFIIEIDEDDKFEELEYEGTFEIENGVMTITLSIDGTERTLTLNLD
jgi:hypothetical protein